MPTHPWHEYETTLTAERDYPRPYRELDVWAEFVHESGITLRRPAYWDGGCSWKLRFASPGLTGRWTWRSFDGG